MARRDIMMSSALSGSFDRKISEYLQPASAGSKSNIGSGGHGLTKDRIREGRKGGWVAAKDLKPGDQVRLADGTKAYVTSVKQTDIVEPVYNFEVEGFHTYHVGELGVWVHNDNCLEVAMKALGVPKENLSSLRAGEVVPFQFATKGGDDVYGFLSLNESDSVLVSQLFSISNKTGGAPVAFRKFLSNSQTIGKNLGVSKIEIQAGSVINDTLARGLISRGFETKIVNVPPHLGGGQQDVLYKMVDIK